MEGISFGPEELYIRTIRIKLGIAKEKPTTNQKKCNVVKLNDMETAAKYKQYLHAHLDVELLIGDIKSHY